MKYYIFGLSSKSKILANTILFSFFTFYIDEKEIDLKWSKIGKIGLEKEGYQFYLNAARASKKALVLAIVSEKSAKKQFVKAEERQASFSEMITVALEITLSFE